MKPIVDELIEPKNSGAEDGNDAGIGNASSGRTTSPKAGDHKIINVAAKNASEITYFVVILSLFVAILVALYKFRYNPNVSHQDRVPFDGRFRIDVNGNWKGDPDYDLSSALYEIRMNSALLGPDTYAGIIKNLRERVLSLVKKSVDRDASWTLLMWSSFSITSNIVDANEASEATSRNDFAVGSNRSSGTVDLSLTGDARYLYDQHYYSAGVANGEDGDFCYISNMFPTYEFHTSSLKLSLPLDVDAKHRKNTHGGRNYEEPCASVFSLQDDFGVTASTDVNTDIKFDMRSIATALAVNLQLLSLSSLTLHSEVYSDPSDGVDFIRFYKDSRYDAMEPILCFKYTNSSGQNPNLPSFEYSNKTTCVIVSGWNLFYPITTHAGMPTAKTVRDANHLNYCWKRTEKWTKTSKCPTYILRGSCDLDIHVGLLFFPWRYQYEHTNEQYSAYAAGSPWLHVASYVDEENGNEVVDYYDRFLFESMYMLPINPVLGKFSMLQETVDDNEDGDKILADRFFDATQTISDLYRELNWFGGTDGYEDYLDEVYGGNSECPSSYKAELKKAFGNIGCEGCSLISFAMQQKYHGSGAWMPQKLVSFANSAMYPLEKSRVSYNNSFFYEDVFDAMEGSMPTIRFQTRSRSSGRLKPTSLSFLSMISAGSLDMMLPATTYEITLGIILGGVILLCFIDCIQGTKRWIR